MTLLDQLRNYLQKPAVPSGDPARFWDLRLEAFNRHFEDEPRIIRHADFAKPSNIGGAVDVLVYPMEIRDDDGAVEPFEAIVTSGLSDYRFQDSDSDAYRHEMIRYVRKADDQSIARLHHAAWVAVAANMCILPFCTMEGHEGEYPGDFFLMSLLQPDADFSLNLSGDEMRLLWQVPITQRELDFKLANGWEALLGRMEEINFPWLYDPANRPPLR